VEQEASERKKSALATIEKLYEIEIYKRAKHADS
jgi:hypothetical protein